MADKKIVVNIRGKKYKCLSSEYNSRITTCEKIIIQKLSEGKTTEKIAEELNIQEPSLTHKILTIENKLGREYETQSYRKAKEMKKKKEVDESLKITRVDVSDDDIRKRLKKCITRRKVESCRQCLWFRRNCPTLEKYRRSKK